MVKIIVNEICTNFLPLLKMLIYDEFVKDEDKALNHKNGKIET